MEADEKERDRNSKTAIASVKVLADLIKQEEGQKGTESIKAADMITKLLSDAKKGK